MENEGCRGETGVGDRERSGEGESLYGRKMGRARLTAVEAIYIKQLQYTINYYMTQDF